MTNAQAMVTFIPLSFLLITVWVNLWATTFEWITIEDYCFKIMFILINLTILGFIIAPFIK